MKNKYANLSSLRGRRFPQYGFFVPSQIVCRWCSYGTCESCHYCQGTGRIAMPVSFNMIILACEKVIKVHDD
jgi:hypothetical protein